MALRPHRRKTQCSNFEDMLLMMKLVNQSQPSPSWEPALPFSTVKTVFSSNTPWRAQLSRHPWEGVLKLGTDASSSLKMLLKLGGT